MKEAIDSLLQEAQRARFTERRTEPRHPFVRPVRITAGRDRIAEGFSKDISSHGIGIVTNEQFDQGTIAVLSIHSTTLSTPVHLKCELRWCDPFGKGWFLTGWKFLSSAAAPGL